MGFGFFQRACCGLNHVVDFGVGVTLIPENSSEKLLSAEKELRKFPYKTLTGLKLI